MRNFLKGYGSVLMIIPRQEFPRVEVKDLHQSDEQALQKDWESIGRDIGESMEKIDVERRK